MKSGRQRRDEIKTGRKQKKVAKGKQAKREQIENRLRYISEAVSSGAVPVNAALLAPSGSYSEAEFVTLGIYLDYRFTCVDCGTGQVWTATQQKWWYEVAKGDRFAKATRCRACRRKERERKTEARRVHLEGLAKKKAATKLARR